MTPSGFVLRLFAPFALALYPLARVTSANPTLVTGRMAFRAAIVISAVTVVVLLLCRIIGRSWTAAVAIASTLYAGGLVYLAVRQEVIDTAHPAFPPAFAVAFVSVLAIVVLSHGAVHEHIGLAAAAMAAALYVPFVDLRVHAGDSAWQPAVDRIVARAASHHLVAPDAPPDIFYVVLDGYARADVLEREFGYNNRPFVEALQNRGFYVAGRARSNYLQTDLSLASSLNVSYLDEIAGATGGRAPRQAARDLVQRSAVVSLLKEAGYRFVLLGSDYATTTWHQEADRCNCSLPMPGRLEVLLARERPGGWLVVERQAHIAHARKVMGTLDRLEAAAVRDGERPRLVMMHVLSPHPPFVVAADGTIRPPSKPYEFGDASHFRGSMDEYRPGYAAQVAYLNARLLKIVDQLIARATVPPVIIIQGDHGPGLRMPWERYQAPDAANRASILSAYFVNERARGDLHEKITPVNTFRVILRHYFSAQLPFLEDASYYSRWSVPFRFTRIEEQPDR